MNKYLIIKTKTKTPNKLILKLYEMSISIKNINYTDDGIEFELLYDDYKMIKKYIKSYSFKIKKYRGLLYLETFLKTKKIFLLNLLLSLFLLFIFSNTIVSVKVYLSKKHIKNYLL